MNKGFAHIGTIVITVLVALPMLVIVTAYMVVHRSWQHVADNPTEVAAALEDQPRTAVIFGSGLREEDGTPRPVLAARLEAAVELYQAGVIDWFVVSGYVEEFYDEPRAMRNFLITRGVPVRVITEDTSGDNTLASCKSAARNLGIEEAVLITQASHLARALYLCRAQGMEAYGYTAEASGPLAARYFQLLREAGGNVRAVFDVLTGGAKPR